MATDTIAFDRCFSSERDAFIAHCDGSLTLTIVVAGASGDLAKKKTYPSLFFLHANKFLPRDVRIIGYARSTLTDDQLHDKLRPYLKSDIPAEIDEFLSICTYIQGSYDPNEPDGFQSLQQAIQDHEKTHPACPAGRLFYLALPPTVYPQIAKGLKLYCNDLLTKSIKDSWIRLVVEKPFGRDLFSSEELAQQLEECYSEEHIYRIDHYLGKEMLQSLFVMRFANSLLAPVWNRASVASVQITFKEDFGTMGRGGYFDHYGIIRDMIATHLTQILAFVAMEKPNSIHPDDIRDEKLKVLRCIRPVDASNCVLGQYTADTKGNKGYLDDATVPPGSNTPTFASLVLYVDNDRWSGVPFVIRAGKALNERKADIRLQLHATPHFIFAGDANDMRNEIVIRLQPDEAIYCKLLVKTPGLEMGTKLSELELDYRRRFAGVSIPDAYSRLILEALRGSQEHFLRRDELRAAWAIFTPLLKEIDAGNVPVTQYEYGSRGPAEADELLNRIGYRRPASYSWDR